ncbi:substrate-binding domain-containing protein [Paenibacillus sp. YYML68]|uniref:substrate-binding domain-containing protein n=1 Tax=Paenibacillus sp. YYML68 TaxID=2909250 RepID=UPI002491A5C2|nr:substrate-binding domain-containing protein [Paenibacillus sp. YYML68]
MSNFAIKITIPRLLLLVLLAAVSILYAFQIPIYTVNSHGEISQYFSSIQELNDQADLIVLAEVQRTKSFKYKNMPFTISTVSISKVVKGNKNKQDTIQVLETGGIMNNVEYTYEHSRAMRRNDKVALYLAPYNGPITQEEAYVVLGVYQGKLQYDESGAIIGGHQHISDDLKSVKSIEDLESGRGGRPAPTALVCANDTIALTAMQALKELGVKVPGDVSVTGFDNIESSYQTSPALTTVHVPKESLGERAVERLLGRIERKQTPMEKLLLSGEVFYRESTAGPMTAQEQSS